MTTSVSEHEYAALAAFRFAMRKFLRFSKDYLTKAADLTPEQYEALLALKAFSGSDGMLVGELSECLQVKHHTAVSLTDKLVAQNLVTKQRGRTDRRHVYVRLTGAGTNLLESLARTHRDELRARSSEMIEALRRLLTNRTIESPAKMLYMVIEQFKEGAAPEIYRRFREKGRMMPKGLEYVSSWIDHDFKSCWQLMQTGDPALFQAWTDNWNDLMEFEIVPVRSSADVAHFISTRDRSRE
jgi:DNA-binding MarR family transcriptional regulator